MKISFGSIQSLNTYLQHGIEGIIEGRDDNTQINTLIQAMRQNEGLLNEENSQPEALVQFLKSAITLRNLTKSTSCFEGTDDLEKVTRAAASVFTHLGKAHIDETFKTIKSLKEVDNAIYLQTLAEWIAVERIASDALHLSSDEWLELAPHLTFLDWRNDNQDILLGNILKKSEKLSELTLEFPAGSGLTMNVKLRLLLPIYRIDQERAVRLGCSLDICEEQLMFYELFVSRYTSILDNIIDWVKQLDEESEPISIFTRSDSEFAIAFITDELFADDPLQQFQILSLIVLVSEDKLPAFLEFFKPFIMVPMDEPLLKFYRLINGDGGVDLDHFATVTPFLVGLDREQQLKYFPYLIRDEGKGRAATIFRNIQNLERTHLFDRFIKNCHSDCIHHVFETENLFTEDREDNLKTIQHIYDHRKMCYIYFGTDEEVHFPEFLKDPDAYFDTAVGKIMLKTFLHCIVKVPGLQEAALRALPPNNKETIALYPQLIKFQDGTLFIRAVPTLPVANWDSFLLSLANGFKNRSLIRIEVTYYGTPAIDASGLGRQLFADVIQGAIVNNKSNFTRTATGGMAPYDPTHSRPKTDPVKRRFHDFGVFFSLALHYRYPVGKVLSDKVLSCLCSFPTAALDDPEFDVTKFLSALKPGELIQYMKESTIDDEALVELYEKVLLTSDEKEVLQAAQQLNDLISDAKLEELINGDAPNILQVQECVRDILIDGADYYLLAVYEMAKGMRKSMRFPDAFGDHLIQGWEDVRRLGPAELSRHLQGELTAKHIKDHLRIKIIGEETPEKVLAGGNVKLWTDQWIDQNSENAEILANFVQAFSGGRALTREIRFDIDPNVHQVKVHTCFNSADIPVNITEGWLRAVFDEFGAGDLRFDMV